MTINAFERYNQERRKKERRRIIASFARKALLLLCIGALAAYAAHLEYFHFSLIFTSTPE